MERRNYLANRLEVRQMLKYAQVHRSTGPQVLYCLYCIDPMERRNYLANRLEVRYCTVLYCTALYCTVLYCIGGLRRKSFRPRGEKYYFPVVSSCNVQSCSTPVTCDFFCGACRSTDTEPEIFLPTVSKSRVEILQAVEVSN